MFWRRLGSTRQCSYPSCANVRPASNSLKARPRTRGIRRAKPKRVRAWLRAVPRKSFPNSAIKQINWLQGLAVEEQRTQPIDQRINQSGESPLAQLEQKPAQHRDRLRPRWGRGIESPVWEQVIKPPQFLA